MVYKYSNAAETYDNAVFKNGQDPIWTRSLGCAAHYMGLV